MSMTTTDAFARAFKVVDTSLLSVWHDVSGDAKPIGDCQAFAWSVLIIETGSKAKAVLAMLTLRAMIWRCWSPQNGIIPRHAVLCYRGKWIDSTNRDWRDGPKPHRRAYPAGLPVLVALAYAASWW